MKLELRDAILARQANEKKFAHRQIVGYGSIVARDGSVEVSGVFNHVWVLPNGDGEPVAVYNRRVKQSRPGLSVVYGFEAYSTVLEILWVDVETIAGVQETAGLDMVNHAASHQPTGDDPLWIGRRSIVEMLYVSPGTGLAVNVAPYAYHVNGTRTVFPGAINFPLTPPAAGQVWSTLVYLDISTNTIATTTGAAVADVGGVSPPKPSTPAGGIGAGYIRLAGSQTSVQKSDIDDGREFLSAQAHMNIAQQIADHLALIEAEYDFAMSKHIVEG
jgi:hypothetical protein